MFKLKKDETISKTFRMPKSLIDKLEKLAHDKDMSLSKIVIQCVEYALENLEKK